MKILQLERWQSSADGVTAILCAGSKKMTGLSLIAYVNERRLAVAAEALKKTDDKILNILRRSFLPTFFKIKTHFRKEL